VRSSCRSCSKGGTEVTSKFRIAAEVKELVVTFEPSGIQVTVPPGDHITVEFTGGGVGDIVHSPDGVMLAGSIADWGPMLAWQSDGTEIHTLC
jgi:hypothetical protein